MEKFTMTGLHTRFTQVQVSQWRLPTSCKNLLLVNRCTDYNVFRGTSSSTRVCPVRLYIESRTRAYRKNRIRPGTEDLTRTVAASAFYSKSDYSGPPSRCQLPAHRPAGPPCAASCSTALGPPWQAGKG